MTRTWRNEWRVFHGMRRRFRWCMWGVAMYYAGYVVAGIVQRVVS